MMYYKNKPKALILAFKNDYMNPTDDAFYKMLDEVFETTYYGPGYVALNNLHIDALDIFRELGPFDVCFVHQYVIYNLNHAKKETVFPGINNQHFYFDTRKFNLKYYNFGKNYNKIPCHKFMLSLRTDCYMFTEGEEKEYDEFEGHIIAPPPEFIAPKKELVNFSKENFIHDATDRYIDYCKNNDYKIIPVSHLIDDNEFKNIPVTKKNILISVPGCPYFERVSVYEKLKKHNMKPVRELPLSTFLRYFIHYSNIQIGSYPKGIKFFKFSFRKLISHSLLSFTDGSRVRAPIRKYFEIPALGTTLLADPFWNYKNFGFIKDENFIACNSDNIHGVISDYLKNPDHYETINKKLQQLIIDKHSRSAWVKRFSDIYNRIEQNTYKGAIWKNGEFKYR